MESVTCATCGKAQEKGGFWLQVTAKDSAAVLPPWEVCSYECLEILAERLAETSFRSEAEREFGGDDA
jgi:hypothetical protein